MADVTPDDLRAAVAAGLLNEASAGRLAAFADERHGLRKGLAADDEPFEFFRGFGEIFISVGLVLALVAIHSLGLALSAVSEDFVLAGAFAALGAAVAWLAAEYFTRRRRMSLPSIVLAAAFAIDAAFMLAAAVEALNVGFGGRFSGDAEFAPPMGLMIAVPGLLLTAIYYRRFRLPFALAPLAVYGLAIAVFATSTLVPDAASGAGFPSASFDLLQSPSFALGALLFGVVAFAFALRFDLRDPHRVSRQSACAFWLHILAAPALVNTVCLTLYNLGGAVGYLAAFVAFGLVAGLAIVIDRRSFLLAGVVYAGLALAAAFRAASGEDAFSGILTVGVLGAFITVLGAKWTAARAGLLGALPDFPGKARLPPY